MRFDFTNEQSLRARKIFYMVGIVLSFITLVLGAVTISKYTSGSSLHWYSSSHSFILFTAAFAMVVSALNLVAYWTTENQSPGLLQWCVHPILETVVAGLDLIFWFFGSIAIAVTTKANSCDSSYLYTGAYAACHVARATIAFSFLSLFVFMLVLSTLLRDTFVRNRSSQYMFTNAGIGPGPHLLSQSALNQEAKSTEAAEVPEYKSQDPALSSYIENSSDHTTMAMPEPEHYTR
ncbi:hypothetical protein H4R33_004144 [Dimargaris cristalligena]|uniref:MARVEL domain-containing protein n=1 Tax=Dimargaris cristalligena TaxID=215637 RepID=A0A4P9ZXD8_9FUNG|nr:hypothetical protein H4R33_004144 [Dimargaris cristalligena]RKP38307.1 hypothetical protein BJ085DRAFT_36774 [Dimargaris cristalligena]|eukprot:RKP38307.1 hypothetical protein BJ085DRAFT_36774 [Dimargaris cristalligena]